MLNAPYFYIPYRLARRFNGFFEAVAHLDRPIPDLVASAFATHFAGLAPGELPAVLRREWEDLLAGFLKLRDDAIPTAADAQRLARLPPEDLNRLLDCLSEIRQELNTRRTWCNLGMLVFARRAYDKICDHLGL